MLKVITSAIVCSAIALGMLAFSIGVGHSQEATPEYKPSWQAMCGYKWRQHKAESGEQGRPAYQAFQRKSEAEGGCGAKAARGANDDRIKAYLESHKPQTMNESGDENQPTYQEARRGKK